MERERWFHAQNHQRRGPVPLSQLVESVLTQGEPRTVLIWRKGLAEWTRAEDIPEVERRLAPHLARKEAEAAARQAPAPAPVAAPAPAPVAAPAPAPPPHRASQGGNPLLVYGGLATGVVVTGLVAWLLWPRSEPPPHRVVPLGGTTTENAPAVVIPAPAAWGEATPEPAAPPTAPPPAATAPAATVAPPVAAATPTPAPGGVAAQETDLPMSEVRKLRQIAAWSGTRLELTVVNETDWRVTELYATVQRFVGNEVLDDDQPILLRPPDVAMDDEVANLLSKVAPDRRKPGVNPLDTGKFSGQAGPRPEAFRCEIVSARGYAPR